MMIIEQIIQTILEQLGGQRFILITGAQFSYGINEKQQLYLRCVLPHTLVTKQEIKHFMIIHTQITDLYQVIFAQQHKKVLKIIKVVYSVCARDLISVFERETGVYCNLATLV